MVFKFNYDEVWDPNLSLVEKMKRHHERRPKRTKRQNEELFNRWGPRAVWALTFACPGYGIPCILPVLYTTELSLRLAQGVAILALAYFAVFWFLTRWTYSTFDPDNTNNGTQGSELTGVTVTSESKPEVDQHGSTESENNSSSLSQSIDSNGATSLQQRTGNGLSITTTNNSNNSGLSHRPGTVSSDQGSKPVVPYWAWKECETCRKARPPRCYHCVLCSRCILKRDHHCYFVGNCIGANNQKYFIAFLFWAVFITTYGLVHFYAYNYYEIVAHISYFDYIPFVAIVRTLFGYVSFGACFFIWSFVGLNLFTALSWVQAYQILDVTFRGQTSFEEGHNLKLKDTRSTLQCWREVMGENWILTFILPYRRSVNVKEDAINWPTISTS